MYVYMRGRLYEWKFKFWLFLNYDICKLLQALIGSKVKICGYPRAKTKMSKECLGREKHRHWVYLV